MKPYYEHAGITIYHGDCREVLGCVSGDAVVADPPYGIGLDYASHDDSLELWFPLMNVVVPMMRRCAPFVVIPSCAINRLGWWYANHAPDWVIAWYKGSPGHAANIGFNDWEPHLVWGKPPAPMHDHFQTVCGFNVDGHPCPKPTEWASWLVYRATTEGGMVVDPFMGSGTTLVAAKSLGRKAIGIEIEERYCEIAAKRLAQEVLPL
jgi:site-specific DNA-methyltransferase (adenine-specific)